MSLILVVESEKLLLSALRDILELDNYDVVTASRNSEALDYLTGDNPRPQVIVASIFDAEDLLKAVRADPTLRQIPFVLMTYSFKLEEARQMGADALVLHPLNSEDFLDTIQGLLKSSAANDKSEDA